MSIFAIGDIHGCLFALQTIFKGNNFGSDDTIVFLGDYVDRGTDTRGVIQYLIDLSHLFHCVFLRGNHDVMMLESRMDQAKSEQWLESGGYETLLSYHIDDVFPWAEQIDNGHWHFLKDTKAFYQMDKFIFVHAGLQPGIPLDQQSPEHLFWKKYVVPERYASDKKVVCGHTSRKNGKIADFGHTICIDTFAYGGQWLTCLNVETNEFIKANEQQKMVAGRLAPKPI